MFIDKARIFVTAGGGGAGCVSFRREKYVPFGGPDGGSGGKGGDVYILADPHYTTLLDLKNNPHYKADSGGNGSGSNKYGRGAGDLIIKVPIGTVVYRDGEIIADLKENGAVILVAKGGRGGRGNATFKTSRNTAPRIAEKGEPGEEVTLELELRLIADVGLVGFPNAGKSTLLSRVSAARPKIADYPFTTLAPNLGVVDVGGKHFVMADIPGLIDGAHEGRGLGDEFLRHIRRTKVLIHLVDVFGFDGKTAYRNYKAINNELARYSKTMLDKPMVVAATKMDLTDSDKMLVAFKKYLKGVKVYSISAATGEGLKPLLAAVAKALTRAPRETSENDTVPVKKYIYEPEFKVCREGDIFVVTGARVEKLAAMTDYAHEEALARFQNILKKMGIDKALQEQGVMTGDTVRIGQLEFTYER